MDKENKLANIEKAMPSVINTPPPVKRSMPESIKTPPPPKSDNKNKK